MKTCISMHTNGGFTTVAASPRPTDDESLATDCVWGAIIDESDGNRKQMFGKFVKVANEEHVDEWRSKFVCERQQNGNPSFPVATALDLALVEACNQMFKD